MVQSKLLENCPRTIIRKQERIAVMKRGIYMVWYVIAMKQLIVWVASLCLWCVICVHANGRDKYSGDPLRIVDEITHEANNESRIQETALDDLSQYQWSYPTQYRLSNTLDALRQQIGPYLEWAFFLAMAMAVILLIYNGLLLVTHSAHGQGDLGEIKKRLTNISIGVILLVWVYTIVRILNAVLQWILG